jgi:hypothetical protein
VLHFFLELEKVGLVLRVLDHPLFRLWFAVPDSRDHFLPPCCISLLTIISYLTGYMREDYACLDFVNDSGSDKLRDALRAIFSAEARGRTAGQAPREALRRELARAYLAPRLETRPYNLSWGGGGRAAIVRSAVELLTSEDRSRLRVCAGEDCDWLFVDGSRNRSRRWCDMSTCGNRAKARRYHERWG